MKQFYIRVKTEEQLKAVTKCIRSNADFEAAVFILPYELLRKIPKDDGLCRIFVDLPEVLRENRLEKVAGYAKEICAGQGRKIGFVIKNIDELRLIKEIGFAGGVICDSFLYGYNTEALDFYKQILGSSAEFMAPDELTDAEREKLSNDSGVDFIYKLYGHQKLMFSAQNLTGDKKTVLKSDRGDRVVASWDENGYTTIYTDRPISMIDKLDELTCGKFLLDFTVESGEETGKVIKSILNGEWGNRGQNGTDIKPERGHHYKGID